MNRRAVWLVVLGVLIVWILHQRAEDRHQEDLRRQTADLACEMDGGIVC